MSWIPAQPPVGCKWAECHTLLILILPPLIHIHIHIHMDRHRSNVPRPFGWDFLVSVQPKALTHISLTVIACISRKSPCFCQSLTTSRLTPRSPKLVIDSTLRVGRVSRDPTPEIQNRGPVGTSQNRWPAVCQARDPILNAHWLEPAFASFHQAKTILLDS